VFRRDCFRVSARPISCFSDEGLVFRQNRFRVLVDIRFVFWRDHFFLVSITLNSCLVDTNFVFRRGDRFRVSARRIVFRRDRFRVSARQISCFGESGFVFRRDRFRVLAKPATLVSCFGKTGFMFWRNRFVFRRD